jgi:hypothetical protein
LCWRWCASGAGQLDELAFLLLGFYAAMTYSRFLFLAAIVLTPMLARALDFFPPYCAEIDKTVAECGSHGSSSGPLHLAVSVTRSADARHHPELSREGLELSSAVPA